MAVRRTSATRAPKRSRSRRLVFAGAVPAIALALISSTPSTADAADVGVIVDTPTGGNAQVRSTPTTSTNRNVVDVLRDGTHLPDAECLVRTKEEGVWTKLTGERYIRADLTGFDTRLSVCSATAQTHQSPDAIDRPSGAPRGAEEYEYHYAFLVGPKDPRDTGVTPEVATAKIVNNFDEEFMFGGCGRQVWSGKKCALKLPGWIEFDIQFDRTWTTGWEFTSLPGTEEGAMRWIKFEFRYNAAGDRLVLDIVAKGPRSALLTSVPAQPLNMFITWETWYAFAEKVAKRNDLCAVNHWYTSFINSPLCTTNE